MTTTRRRIAILAEGKFSAIGAKTATGVIRYSPHEVVAVIDSEKVGMTAEKVLGYGGPVPVVASVRDALALKPEILLIGIAPSGGQLPDEWRPALREAIEGRLDIWSGLHAFLGDDDEIADLAQRHKVRVWDVRKPRPDLIVGSGRALAARAHVCLMIGSDCNVGKMTTGLELQKSARARGLKAAFVATGQTGILIEGEGTPLDAIPGDFMAGEVERLVMQQDADGADVVFVEGQGGILHPGFGPVTLALMLGAMADSYVLCHMPSRAEFRPDLGIPVPPLKQVISHYEHLMEYYKAPKVHGIALNTYDHTPADAARVIAETRALTGLPTVDPFRTGVEPVMDALEPLIRAKRALR
jgi:uncharacterized NAD-dependent epimerase/dehydratase family protein